MKEMSKAKYAFYLEVQDFDEEKRFECYKLKVITRGIKKPFYY